MSIFSHIAEAPVDPILGTALAYKGSNHPNKVNLGIGAYRTEEGKPYVLEVVKKAEALLLDDINSKRVDKEYSTIDGVPGLKPLTQKLIFGQASPKIASTQSLSGTGSLRVCAEFLNTHLGYKKMYYSDPTWGNHLPIFAKAGITPEKYPYWDPATKGIKFAEWMQHMEKAPNASLYLIHPCAHNPTGVDPNSEQWKQVVEVCKRKKHLAILDSAYQGYATGDLVRDRKVIEMFYASGMEFFCCQSFAKNLGLYGERIGMLHVVCSSEERAKIVLSQIKLVIRPMYSSPPIHGSLLIEKILGNERLYNEWTRELKMMADRINEVRNLLRNGLEKKKTPGTWNHITDQIGMFSFTGLSTQQCEMLINDHAIYLLKSGRISLAGLNKANIPYVVDAIDQVVRKTTPSKM